MKESSHLRSDAPIHIINKCIKDASFPDLRDNIIISYCSWYQCAIALFQPYFFTSASHTYFTITLDTHTNNKTNTY